MSHRRFRDAAGVEWDVWAVHPTLAERRLHRERRDTPRPSVERRVVHEVRAHVREDLRFGWLAFRSATERRLRTPIPPGWEEYTDQELGALLETAERAGVPRHLG